MLKIWGRRNSINVQKALWTAEICGRAYDSIEVGGAFGGTQEPNYLAMNPNKVVPTLQDGEVTVWESNSIVRYLASRYAIDGFWPGEPAARSRAERWMDWQLSTLNTPMRDLFWGYVRTAPEKRDVAALQEAFTLAGAAMRILDAHLSSNAFVAGETFTMGDVPVGCFTYRWFTLPLDRPDLPHLARWYESLHDKPGYRRHVMVTMT
ncbi:MAG: glutathione S-transferase [Alphaproteobacteria bacterium]|nr:glutathione S-transferase [Alphaproteobacteria bacterium]